MSVSPGYSPNSNGANANILSDGPTDIETISKTGGGTFNLLSVDLAIEAVFFSRSRCLYGCKERRGPQATRLFCELLLSRRLQLSVRAWMPMLRSKRQGRGREWT